MSGWINRRLNRCEKLEKKFNGRKVLTMND